MRTNPRRGSAWWCERLPRPMGFLAPNRHCDVSVWRWGSPLFRPQCALLAPPVRSRGSRGISHRSWVSVFKRPVAFSLDLSHRRSRPASTAGSSRTRFSLDLSQPRSAATSCDRSNENGHWGNRSTHRIWGSLPIQAGRRVVNGPAWAPTRVPSNFDEKPAARRGAAGEVGTSLLEHLFDMMGTWPPTKFSAFSAH